MANKASKRREKGTGTIYQRDNGTWVGKIDIGLNENGKRKFKCFSGKTEAEVKRKIREYNKSDNHVDTKRVSVGTYLMDWLMTYKKGTIKPGSLDALEKTIKNHIVPNIGFIQLQSLSSEDVQRLLVRLKDVDGYSHSTVKKVYDCLNAAFTHAILSNDVARNPMSTVKMPDKNLFKTKEIRVFNEKECSLIIEECSREYSTGALVYQYADVYILMMNTGIRLGEAIGIKVSDIDFDNRTIHIRRNLQSVSKRDNDGNRITGKVLVENTTKTYSGNRIIPLNDAALTSLNRLCASADECEYVVHSSSGKPVPPERIERTFYRILRNAGIEKCGTHSLRHTFASMLFANGVDIKTVSELLGHASIQITMNTYVHLIGNTKHAAVDKLNEITQA